MSRKIYSVPALVLTATLVSPLTGCSDWTKRDRNTALGAGVGAVGGHVLTSGSGLGTLSGAAVGGIIGNHVEK